MNKETELTDITIDEMGASEEMGALLKEELEGQKNE